MKEIRYSKDARKELLSGVELIAKAVKTTLGPSGANVLIRNTGEKRPFSTKDGVTVAGQISSPNPIEQVAIESLQDIANITDEGAGDGTTTATVLAEAILKEGMRDIDNHNLFDVKRGVEEASRLVIKMLEENSLSIKDDQEKLRDVAMISSNGDKEIADTVFDAFTIAGKQGIVNIKRSRTFDTYVKSIEGMVLPVGYISRFYATTPEGNAVLEKPWIYITNKKITKVSDNLEYFLGTAAAKGESVLIMCGGLDPAIAEMFIRNHQQGSIRMCVTKNPGFGNEQEDLLQDLATTFGANPFIENEGLDFDEIAQEDLFKFIPRSKEVTVTEHTISFMEPYIDVSKETVQKSLMPLDENGRVGVAPTGAELETAIQHAIDKRDERLELIRLEKNARAEALRSEVENTQTQYEKSVLQTRISRLSDGIAFINIGARSETEFIEKQARVQDALYAVKAANEEGIIPGGGSFLYWAAAQLSFMNSHSGNKSILYGAEVLRLAIMRPMMQIIENVGDTLDEENLGYIALNMKAGYNAITRDVVRDMIDSKIIDPAKVTRVALESAVSIASMILTTECVVVDTAAYAEPNQRDY